MDTIDTDLHEEDMGNVQFPHVVLVAELDTLPEDLLHLSIVLSVPVDPGLGHQHWHIATGTQEPARGSATHTHTHTHEYFIYSTRTVLLVAFKCHTEHKI